MAFLQSVPRTRIELSPQEMLVISQTISREFAPRFVRSEAAVSSRPLTFSAQELLAISQEISREFAPRPDLSRSSLVLLPIDPHRLHAYWHLAPLPLTPISKPVVDEHKPATDEQLTLRVFKQSKPVVKTNDNPEKPSWFDIPIDSVHSRQDITLPNDTSVTRSIYSAAIGISHGEHDFIALAYSNAAPIPNLTVNSVNADLPDIIAQFIMPNMHTSSSIGKAATHQEIIETR